MKLITTYWQWIAVLSTAIYSLADSELASHAGESSNLKKSPGKMRARQNKCKPAYGTAMQRKSRQTKGAGTSVEDLLPAGNQPPPSTLNPASTVHPKKEPQNCPYPLAGYPVRASEKDIANEPDVGRTWVFERYYP